MIDFQTPPCPSFIASSVAASSSAEESLGMRRLSGVRLSRYKDSVVITRHNAFDFLTLNHIAFTLDYEKDTFADNDDENR